MWKRSVHFLTTLVEKFHFNDEKCHTVQNQGSPKADDKPRFVNPPKKTRFPFSGKSSLHVKLLNLVLDMFSEKPIFTIFQVQHNVVRPWRNFCCQANHELVHA